MSDEVDAESEELKKPAKEVLVVFDQGFFVHETGDTYDGMFEVRKKDRFLKMCGPGVYTTAEGDIYTGTWDADKLIDEATISYTDGSNYEGPIKDWSYNGCGKYTYPDGTVLTTEFAENCPLREMAVKDPNGHVWLGRAEAGYGWLDPWNHFYQALERREKSQSGQGRAFQHNSLNKGVDGNK